MEKKAVIVTAGKESITNKKVIAKKITALVVAGKKAGTLVAYDESKSTKDKHRAMMVVIDRNAELYPQVAIGQYWQLEVHNVPGKKMALGQPVAPAPTKSVITHSKGDTLSLGMEYSLVENKEYPLTGFNRHLIFTCPFPNNLQMNELLEKKIETKLTVKFKQFAFYMPLVMEAAIECMQELRDHRREYDECVDQVEKFLEEIPQGSPSNTSLKTVTFSKEDILNDIMGHVCPFGVMAEESLPSREQIQNRLDGYQMIFKSAVEISDGDNKWVGLGYFCPEYQPTDEEIDSEMTVEVMAEVEKSLQQ